MHQKAFGGRAPPGPAGEAALPRTSSRIRGLGPPRKGGEGREWEGKGENEGERGRGKGKEGEGEGEGRKSSSPNVH